MAGDQKRASAGQPARPETPAAATGSPVRLSLSVAIAYLLVAAIGHQVAAFAPLQQAPVWPAAGVGLAAVLLFGMRCLPALLTATFVGYLLFWTDAATRGVEAATLLTLGAGLQAVLAARWTRGLRARAGALTGDRDLLAFLILIGPLACLAAALATTAIMAWLVAPPDFQPGMWLLSYWGGHTLGVLLFAPAALVLWPGVASYRRTWGRGIALPLLLAAAILAAGQIGIARIEAGEAEKATEQRKLDTYHHSFIHLNGAVTTLEFVERFFAASEEVTTEEFEVFTLPALLSPGIVAVAWLPRVSADERAHFEAVGFGREAGGVRISEYAEDGRRIPAAEREVHFPGYLVQPLVGNELTLGLDFHSIPSRRAAMQRAAAAAAPSAAEPGALVQTGRPGFAIFVPVYDRSLTLDPPPEARQAALRGFVLGSFDIARLLAPLQEHATARGLAFRVSDRTPGYAPQPIFASLADAVAAPWRRELAFADRTLVLELASTEAHRGVRAAMATHLYPPFAATIAFLVALATLAAAGRLTTISAEVAARTAALSESERRYRDFIERSPYGVFVQSGGRFAFLNRRAQALLGAGDAEKLLGRPVLDFLHPDSREAVARRIRALNEDGVEAPALEERWLRLDGSGFYGEATAVPYRHEGQQGALVVLQDITARKLATIERDRLFELSTDLVCINDSDGRFVRVNPAFCRILGWSEDEIVQMNYRELLHPEDLAESVRLLRELQVTGRTLRDHEVRVRCKDGGYRWILWRTAMHETRLYSVGMDTSERRAALEELKRARAEAEQANRAKSAFLAAMSHEIRTPMNGVLGMVEVLARGQLSAHQAELIETVRGSANTLLRLIDDILDFSKIEAGRLDLEHEPLCLATLVESLCTSLVTVAARKRVELHVFVAPDLPALVTGDEVRLRQVLYNLVGNAIKFSAGLPDRRGRVSVRIEVIGGEPFRVAFAVADNGIGMDAATRRNLFQPFTQAETSTTRRFGGSGLGLAICRRLVEMMGGSIEVQSAPDEGSLFTVTLPFDLPAQQPALPSLDLSGLHCVLLQSPGMHVEDLRSYLVHAGASVLLAEDTDRAVQAARAAARSVVVIHDLGDRQPDAAAATAPFARVADVRHLLLARGRRRRFRILDAHCVLIDADALRRQTLLRAVAVAAGRASPEVIHADEAADRRQPLLVPTIEKARADGTLILVAEDDDTNQKVIRQQLALLGYAAEIAGNGAEALQKWREGSYALLITDLHMPELDGYQLAAAIRDEEGEGMRTPILALTANALRGEEQRALAAGVDVYLTKPVPIPTLERALAQFLGGRGADSPVRAGATGDGALLDVAVLRSLIGNDEAVVRSFLRDYRSAAGKMGAEIEAAQATGDVEAVAALAHKLKSASRSVGARGLGTLCEALERAGKSGDASQVARLLPELSTTLAEVGREIAIYLQEASR